MGVRRSLAWPCLLLALVLVAPVSADGLTLTARDLLERLPVRVESGSSTYDRERFGYPADLDGDTCDTRAEVLMVESTTRTTRNSYCTIQSGRWISFVDGRVWTDPGAVQIDHLVPLSEAWASGARAWTSRRMVLFGNDMVYAWSLNAITGSLNASKGDGDPSEWLPPLASARCQYAIRWMKVKFRWGLSVDSAERGALERLLSGSCGERLITLPRQA